MAPRRTFQYVTIMHYTLCTQYNAILHDIMYFNVIDFQELQKRTRCTRIRDDFHRIVVGP